ncbi:MAG TPA: hypothetical protein PK637_17120 [Flavobacteriales bacterium]|nr:hypothetical protein [Flavobacteriales bacterium]
MNQKVSLILSTLLFILGMQISQAQLSISGAGWNPFNITPISVCQANITNMGQQETVVLESRLFNSANEPILQVVTAPFVVKSGMNPGHLLPITISSFSYGVSGQAQFIRSNHTLPSGSFRLCITIRSLTSEFTDDYCDEFNSDLNSYLHLVYPYDKDTIEETHPMLIWAHSEPFNVLIQGEYFRLILVKNNSDQTAESAVTVNLPQYQKNYVNTHELQYPLELKALQEGETYSWQIQKISNGSIVQKSEAWSFTIKKPGQLPGIIFASVKSHLENSWHIPRADILYFRFDEGYFSSKTQFFVRGDDGIKIPVVVDGLDVNNEPIEKTTVDVGFNRCALNVKKNNLKKGKYTLEVKDSKNKSYYLRFNVN